MRETEGLGDSFVFLSDIGGEFASQYAGVSGGTFNAATYVIDKEGKIAYRYNDGDFTKRPPAQEVLEAVKKVVG